MTQQTDVPPASAPTADETLKEKILAEFLRRLQVEPGGGDVVASALAPLLRGAKMPKRDVILQSIRMAIRAGDVTDGTDS